MGDFRFSLRHGDDNNDNPLWFDNLNLYEPYISHKNDNGTHRYFFGVLVPNPAFNGSDGQDWDSNHQCRYMLVEEELSPHTFSQN